MAGNIYLNATDEEIVQAYNSMMDYSGRITPDLQLAIDARGGLARFKADLEFRRRNAAELNRIRQEVVRLFSPEIDLAFLKTLITSETVAGAELDRAVELEYVRLLKSHKDRSITSRTIIGSISGMLLSYICGVALLLGSVWIFDRLFYYLLVPVYFVSYLIVKAITRQSRNNLVVFVACVAATVAAFATVLFLLRP